MSKENTAQETTKPMAYDALLGTVPDDENGKPYCTDCGNDDLAYIDQYANGEYWKCKECGNQFIW